MTTAFEFSASYSSFFRRSKLPHLSQMKAFYLLGVDEATSIRNLVPNSPYPAASKIGAPTYGAAYAEINGTTNYFKGNFLSTNQPFTHFALGNLLLTPGQRATYCGYNFPINNRGVSFVYGNPGASRIEAFFRDAALAGVTPVINVPTEAFGQINTSGLYVFTACTYDGANFTVYAHDGRQLLSVSSAASGVPDPGIDWYIGYGTSTGQNFRVAAAGTADVAMAVAQVKAQANYVRKLGRARGLNVL